MSRGLISKEFDLIRGYNYLLYYKFLFGFVNDFKKDVNYFFIDFQNLGYFLFNLKYTQNSSYKNDTITFLETIKRDEKVTIQWKDYIYEFLKNFTNTTNT